MSYRHLIAARSMAYDPDWRARVVICYSFRALHGVHSLSKGEVRAIDGGILDGSEIESAVIPALTSARIATVSRVKIADCSYRLRRRRKVSHQPSPSTGSCSCRDSCPSISKYLRWLTCGLPPIGGGAEPPTAWPRAGRRSRRIGKVHYACRVNRSDQPT